MTPLAVSAIAVATDHTGNTDRFRITLSYDPAQPYEVALNAGTTEPWVFHRELLIGGLRTLTGLGDVQIWPYQGCVRIRLSVYGETVLLDISAIEALFMAEQMLLMVPRGREHEHVDVDAAIARILSEAAR